MLRAVCCARPGNGVGSLADCDTKAGGSNPFTATTSGVWGTAYNKSFIRVGAHVWFALSCPLSCCCKGWLGLPAWLVPEFWWGSLPYSGYGAHLDPRGGVHELTRGDGRDGERSVKSASERDKRTKVVCGVRFYCPCVVREAMCAVVSGECHCVGLC